MEETNDIFFTFGSNYNISNNYNLIDIENMDPFYISPHVKSYINNIISLIKPNNNPFSIKNIDQKYLYNIIYG